MAHYHKARGQQAKKWERFEQCYGMSPSEWRELKKTDPQKAHALRMHVAQRFIAGLKTVRI